VVLTVHNDEQQPRKFAFDRCDLDAGNDAMVPNKVDHDLSIGYDTDLDHEPEIAAGDSIDRRCCSCIRRTARRPVSAARR